jgi:hypothetical protein
MVDTPKNFLERFSSPVFLGICSCEIFHNSAEGDSQRENREDPLDFNPPKIHGDNDKFPNEGGSVKSRVKPSGAVSRAISGA